MKLASIDKTLDQEKPFTVYVSKVNPLDKFNSIESTYLSSHDYGKKDLQLYLDYMVVPNGDDGPDYALDMPSGKTSCKSAPGYGQSPT